MAKLEDVMPEFKGGFHSQAQAVINSKALGTKRRAWLESDLENQAGIQKGSIDTIYKPDSSSYVIGSITLEPPTNKKGPINSVYRPLCLCFVDLRSNPLKLIRFLFALSSSENNEYKTCRVRLKEMMQQLDISKDSARTALRFLLKNNLISRIEYQVGVHGWSRYKIEKGLANEIETGILKGSITPFKMPANFQDQNLEDSELINKQITLDTIPSSAWGNVDITLLEKINFNNKHLLQLKSKTTPEIVQESIKHFSFALENNAKAKAYANPIATFIAVMKRGEAWIEPNYRSPQELAQQKFLENKRMELERKQKLEEEAYKLSLIEWQQSLKPEEIENIAPNKKASGDVTPQPVKLSMYFKENIWPQKKIEYLIVD